MNFKSSLLVLQTGGGKSLCYQLPSYIYKTLNIPNLTLVISPTISLMQDQLFCLPKTLEGALLVNSLTESEVNEYIYYYYYLNNNYLLFDLLNKKTFIINNTYTCIHIFIL